MSVSISVPGSARFSVGRVLLDGFGILARNFIRFAAIAIAFRLLWLLIPAINSALEDALNEGALDQSDWKSQLIQYLVGLVISGLTQAAIIYGTMQNLRGQSASWSDIGRGLSFAPLVIVVVCSPTFRPFWRRSSRGRSPITSWSSERHKQSWASSACSCS
jgi:hypothetical protein